MFIQSTLSRESADAWNLGHIYFVAVQLVMLYRKDIWFMIPHIGAVLGKFHHRAANRLTGRQPCRGQDGVWFYLPLEDAITEAVLQEVETYVS